MADVVCGVVERAGCYLVGLRAGARDHVGRWEFPGGKTEWTETDAQALQRELREEIGLRCAVGERLCELTLLADGSARSFTVTAHLVQPTEVGEPVSADGSHSLLEWRSARHLCLLPRAQVMPSLPAIAQVLLSRELAVAAGAPTDRLIDLLHGEVILASGGFDSSPLYDMVLNRGWEAVPRLLADIRDPLSADVNPWASLSLLIQIVGGDAPTGAASGVWREQQRAWLEWGAGRKLTGGAK